MVDAITELSGILVIEEKVSDEFKSSACSSLGCGSEVLAGTAG